jgi:hypothetical protein
MKRIIYLIIVSLVFTNVFAQSKISKLHSKQKLYCTVCHECETPTKINPCLAKCPRENTNVVTYKVKDAPKVLEINNIKAENDFYNEVNFSHKAHAEMAEMNTGCVTCHHYNPPGKIVKCNHCHIAERELSQINMPDLKAAYHRQCMDCHTSWEEETKCESCHALKSEYLKSETKVEIVKTHMPVERPASKVYETESEIGKLVTFHHADHINLFNLQCTDCHQNETCQSCHNQKVEFQKIVDGNDHSRCSACHDTEKKDQCSKCHADKETKSFNHAANTRFDINKYHRNSTCKSCHKTEGKYSGLKSSCQSCHEWNQENFKHAVTGLKLSDDHTDVDCSDCHVNNNYSKTTCSDCHDEEYIYPKKSPGTRIK